MVKNFTLIALPCFLIILLGSCTKDPESTVNPGGTSIYSFVGTPGSCFAPTIAGIYSVGVAMNASNTLTFSVNVTAKGSYTINTTGVNGVSFTGTGIFTATGPQTVVLTGRGTPIKKGNFSFVPATNNTCNFSVSFLDGAPAAVFTYAGAPGNCTAPAIIGIYAAGVPLLGSGNYVDLAVDVTTPGAYTISTASINGISFSGSGAFTNAGPGQAVRLIGNGTPAMQGPYTFTPSGGCNFSITVAPPPPPASFTYTCAAPTISGTFAAGTALTSSSTIVVPVNVSVAGQYSVSTNPDNGVTFSASGVFSGTGPGSITLRSTNTPAAAGTFSYTPSGAGCSFDITYTSGPPPPPDFLTCKINGVTTNFNNNLIGSLDQTSSPYTFDITGENSGGGVDNFSLSLTDMGSQIANGNYSNITATNTNKGCLAVYSPTFGSTNPFFSSPLNNGTFTVTITGITATKVNGSFTGTIFDNFGLGTVSKSISAGSFSVTY